MTIRRINLLGGSGCGASTLGRALAGALALPHFDADDYFHAPADPPFSRPRPPAERCALLENDLAARPGWVLSGGVGGWEPAPRLDFTLVVFLWLPTEVRIARLRRRERERFGDRVLPGGDMHAAHEEFIDWASRYDRGDVEGKTLARHEAYLATLTCPVLELRGERSTADALHEILARIGAHH